MKGSENRLVVVSKDILRLLLDGGTNANQIVKQTSSDRTYVFNVINMLQQEGLISESRDPKHSQKKIKNLTALGREIAELVKLIDPYTEACDKLKESKEKYFNAIQNKLSNSSLEKTDNKQIVLQTKESESKKTEINQLDLYAMGIAILEYETADYIKDLTIFTYSSLLRRFNVQKTTKVILNQIIRSATERQIDTMLNNIEDWKGDPSELVNEFSEHGVRIIELPRKMKHYGLLSNKFINKEAKEVLLSVVSILKPQKRTIQYYISNKNSNREVSKMIKELGKEIDKLKDRINSSETSKFKNTTNLSEISRAKEIRYAKEDPSEQEMKAFYEEILKVLS